jgi:hypothetical protein
MFSRLIPLLALAGATAALGQGYAPQGYVPQGYMPQGYAAPAPAPAPAAAPAMSPTATPYYGADAGYGYAPTSYGAPATGVNPSSLLSYGLLEGYYQYNTFKDTGLDASHGLGLNLTAQLFQPLFLRGAFSWASGNGKLVPDGYSLSTVQLGAGAYLPVSDRFHLVGEVGGLYSTLTASKSAVSFSDGALYVRPSIRFAATESLELQGGMMITSADDYNSRQWDLNAYYRLFTAMDVGFGAGFGDQTNNYRAGVRFRW